VSAAARTYIRGIVEGLTPSSLAMHRFADIDGPRAQSFPSLDAADGRTRLFEVPTGEVAQVNLAGPDIQAMDERLSLRIRYDAAAADRVALHDAMRADQLQVAQALRAGAWAAVTGLAALTATPGRVDDIGDGEGRMLAHVAEVDIYISFDV
jgi:hypothetical protein